MTTFGQKLDNAAADALCQGLDYAGGALIGAGAVSLVFGGPVAVPIALGVASLMAANAGCNWDPNKEPPGPDKQGRVGGCLEVQGKVQVIWVGNGPNQPANPFLTWRRLDSAIFTGVNADGDSLYQVSGLDGNGNLSTVNGSKVSKQFEPGYFTLNSDAANPCGRAKELPDIPPIDVTDPDDGCKLIVNWKGIASGKDGILNPVFKIEAGDNGTFFDSGRDYPTTGNCNFQPVLYTGGPGGLDEPPIVTPWLPEWDDDPNDPAPWLDDLKDIADLVKNCATAEQLDAYLGTPFPGTTYALNSICELDDQGNPEVKTVERQIPSVPPLASIATRIDALVPLLQGQKDFKQPICPPVKPEGEFRTIGFISESYSPNGRNYLRKRLRYRSMSGIGLGELIDYWKDFQFDAGPVTVKHRGASWGTITVWAASADEGKRVIRHAAGEALIDADQVGRWEISGSTSSRLGMPGRMRVNNSGGFYWITERDGSSARPLVGTI